MKPPARRARSCGRGLGPAAAPPTWRRRPNSRAATRARTSRRRTWPSASCAATPACAFSTCVHARLRAVSHSRRPRVDPRDLRASRSRRTPASCCTESRATLRSGARAARAASRRASPARGHIRMAARVHEPRLAPMRRRRAARIRARRGAEPLLRRRAAPACRAARCRRLLERPPAHRRAAGRRGATVGGSDPAARMLMRPRRLRRAAPSRVLAAGRDRQRLSRLRRLGTLSSIARPTGCAAAATRRHRQSSLRERAVAGQHRGARGGARPDAAILRRRPARIRVVFTANASGAIRILAEAFPFRAGRGWCSPPTITTR